MGFNHCIISWILGHIGSILYVCGSVAIRSSIVLMMLLDVCAMACCKYMAKHVCRSMARASYVLWKKVFSILFISAELRE